MIRIGKHLVWTGHAYELRFTADETKTNRPHRAPLPPHLTPYIERYLQTHRPRLLDLSENGESAATTAGFLWVGCREQPLSGKGIRTQIKLRTEEAFGTALGPHLFRDCAVTGLVDVAPDRIALAPDLLGHGRLETTQKHYIQAKGMQAHAAVQSWAPWRAGSPSASADAPRAHQQRWRA